MKNYKNTLLFSVAACLPFVLTGCSLVEDCKKFFKEHGVWELIIFAIIFFVILSLLKLVVSYIISTSDIASAIENFRPSVTNNNLEKIAGGLTALSDTNNNLKDIAGGLTALNDKEATKISLAERKFTNLKQTNGILTRIADELAKINEQKTNKNLERIADELAKINEHIESNKTAQAERKVRQRRKIRYF